MKTKLIRVFYLLMLLILASCKKVIGVPEITISPAPNTPEEMAKVLDLDLPPYSIELDTVIFNQGLRYHEIKLVFDNNISEWTKSLVENDTTWYKNKPEGYVKEVQDYGTVSAEKTSVSAGLNLLYNIVVHAYISPEHNGVKLYTLDDSETVKSDMGF